MAAPHVAGACALVWAARPDLTHTEVKQAIMNSVDHIPALSTKCVSGGRLNLYKAIKSVSTPVVFTAIDEDYCVNPDDSNSNTINYTISYDANGFTDTNVRITSKLPDDTEFLDSSRTCVYDSESHTVIWIISPFTNGSFTLTVRVLSTANPGGTLTNIFSIKGDSFKINRRVKTCVDCYKGSAIYVDKDAPPGGSGIGWPSAIKTIEEAITAAVQNSTSNCPMKEIWIKAGTYTPPTGGYELSNGISLIGHFSGTENKPSERNLSDPNFETILEAPIGDTAVKAVSVINTFVDGFTVTGYPGWCTGFNITSNSEITVSNCLIKDLDKGLNLSGSQANSYNCTFYNNSYGIYAQTGTTADIADCLFNSNSTGINAAGCTWMYITDSTFDGNDIANTGLYASSIADLTITGCTFERFSA
jgi:hypothetical protein